MEIFRNECNSTFKVGLNMNKDNVNALKFYQKQGMKLGGVDTLFYTANPNISVALQWYKIF